MGMVAFTREMNGIDWVDMHKGIGTHSSVLVHSLHKKRGFVSTGGEQLCL